MQVFRSPTRLALRDATRWLTTFIIFVTSVQAQTSSPSSRDVVSITTLLGRTLDVAGQVRAESSPLIEARAMQ